MKRRIHISLKKAITASVILVLGITVIVFLRGPYVSNILRVTVLPPLEKALGQEVAVQRIYVNLLPLSVEAEDLRTMDNGVEGLVWAESVKAYISIWNILSGELTVNSLLVKKPRIRVEESQIDGIVTRASSEQGSGKRLIRLKIKTVAVKDGLIEYRDESSGTAVKARGLDATMLIRKHSEVQFTADTVMVEGGKLADLKGVISGDLMFKKDELVIRKISAEAMDSTLQVSGTYSYDGSGSFRVDSNLLIQAVKDMRKLEKSGYGSIFMRGKLLFEKGMINPYVDMDVKGDFYLETLLEYLRAKPKSELKGLISVNGSVKGHWPNIVGEGKAKLSNALLYGVDVDDVSSNILYKNNILSFKEGNARLYDGRAKVDVSLTLPKAYPYTVDVAFSGVNSFAALELIKFTSLKIPEGNVKGTLYTSGIKFRPEGWVVYEATHHREDPFGRINKITGNYSLEGKILSLKDMEATADHSRLNFEGTLDTKDKLLDFAGGLNTADIQELTTPYFDKVTATGIFNGTVTGFTHDPLVSGKITMNDVSYLEYPIGTVEGDASYRMNLLTVSGARAVHGTMKHMASGQIAFPDAKGLLELKNPSYDMRIALEGSDLGGLLKAHALDIPVDGRAYAVVSLNGEGKAHYSGSAEVLRGKAYGQKFKSANFTFDYDFKRFLLEDGVFRRGKSELRASGSIARDGAYSFKADADNAKLVDLVDTSLPLEYNVDVNAEGEGNIKSLKAKARVMFKAGSFRGVPLGGGLFEARIDKDSMDFKGSAIKGKLVLKGSARLEAGMPWHAKLDIGEGRYDFLLGALLKDIPEDMLFNIKGNADISGRGRKVEGLLEIEQLHLTMFGQSFVNDEEIAVFMEEGSVDFARFSLRSGSTMINVSGGFKPGESYDVVMEGTSSLSPLKGFSQNIDILRGRTTFVLGLQGSWENPLVNGGLVIENASLGIKGVPQRLASVNGSLYFDNNELIIERTSAKLGGGEVQMSGLAQMDGMSVDRMSLDLLVNDVNMSLSQGFNTSLGGNLVYSQSKDTKILTGEVRINRANYENRLEWKSWLLKLRQAEAVKAKADALNEVKLNVRVYGDEKININNNIATASLDVDLILGGNVGEPLLIGRVEAIDGKVYFRNSEFEVVRATADFSDTFGTSPYIDIVAETAVKGYHVWLTLEGRLDQLDLTLLSDPDLDDVEILALLTVGAQGESLRGLEGGIGAAEATSILTGEFQDVVEERMRELTGITRFSIDPYVSSKTGTITPRLTVSKRLIEERLYVTYASSISTSEDQEIKLEYVILRNVSLVGGQDDLGSLGGDIKIRFRFK